MPLGNPEQPEIQPPDQEIVARICKRLSAGEPLATICALRTMPDLATVEAWAAHSQTIEDQLANAIIPSPESPKAPQSAPEPSPAPFVPLPRSQLPKPASPGEPTPFPYQPTLNAICEELATGKSMLAICSADGMPSRESVAEWCEKWPDTVGSQVARARFLGEQQLLDRVIAVVSDKARDPQCRKVEAWGITEYLKRLNPKRWGDQAGAGTTVNVGVAVNNVVTEERIREAQARKRASIERRRRAAGLLPESQQRPAVTVSCTSDPNGAESQELITESSDPVATGNVAQ